MLAPTVEELDTETFIELVKAHPEIWDNNSEEYREKRIREAAWEDISNNLIEGFYEKEDGEKTEIIRKISTRWRNIRDTFLKSEKKKARTGKPPARGRQYIYAKQLTFLIPLLGLPQSSVNEEEDERSLSPESRISDELTQNPSTSTKSSLASRGQGKMDLERSLLKFLNQSLTTEPPDDDQLFFDSIKPYVKQFSEDKKLEFRTQVLSLVKKIKSGSGSN
ncbi:uncharacterized protein [Halyomorpha halys]|uniref:uncharacterized protein n=1 Tax=Halyomorpha halys TaxID=286706 RepID=UPI0006D51BD5|nr:uncharacterized protein LOC106691570 [Halyomorpha halys]XP_014292878.1 uncharacterized protein LOC106691570 [Halyomorpha halys]